MAPVRSAAVQAIRSTLGVGGRGGRRAGWHSCSSAALCRPSCAAPAQRLLASVCADRWPAWLVARRALTRHQLNKTALPAHARSYSAARAQRHAHTALVLLDRRSSAPSPPLRHSTCDFLALDAHCGRAYALDSLASLDTPGA